MDEADRVYADLLTATELLSGPLEGARVDRHDGYAFMLFPEFPLPSFNGIWAESDAAASALEEAHGEVTSHGLPFGVLVRAGKAPAVEEAAGGLGLTEQLRLPAMAVTPDELVTPADGVEIVRVETADGLAQSLALAAAGFGIPASMLACIYMLDVAEIEGIQYYLARADGKDVSTAIGLRIGDTVGVFNVATPTEHRGHGYGAAVTAHAVAECFGAGAELAWLQSSALGESVYRRLGFREVDAHLLFYAPHSH